jgi:heptaprenyl diphosphate synthase
VESEADQSGKTPGIDLREGVRTLPVLHALRAAGPGDTRLVELLSSSDLTDQGRRSEALALLRAHPAMAMAKEDLRQWTDRARADIMALPAVPARAAFEALCDFVAERNA